MPFPRATPVLLPLLVLGACSGDPDAGAGGGNGTGGTGIVVGVGGSGNSSNAPQNGSGGSNLGSCGKVAFDGCVGESYEGEHIPLDIYIMFDQSGSMLNDVGGMTRLQAIQRAAEQFLRDPASNGIGVGIGYFGFLPIGNTSCDVATYDKPDVAISLDHESVIASLNSRMPTGETPTAAALRGACTYAKAAHKMNPSRALSILLMTDGKPEAPVSCGTGGCCPTLSDATQAAAECAAGSQGIPTYVLGVGPELQNLNDIAKAGATKSAYLVGDKDVTVNVLTALNAIRGAAVIPCDLEIPPANNGGALDYGQVNVVYSTSGCNFQPAFYVASEAKCDATGGWYYDDPNAPKRVKLCPSTCDEISRPGAALRFSVGCQSLPPPVR
jgi:hypothetical protein